MRASTPAPVIATCPGAAGASRAAQAAEAAAVRQAVSAVAPSRPRTSPVSLSSTITIAEIAGSPRARLPGKTLTSLTPLPSSEPT